MRRTSSISNAAPAFGDLLLDPGAELEPWDTLGEAGKVLDPLGVEDGSTQPDWIEQDRASSVTRSEESCGETGRPSTRDGDLAVRHHVRRPIIGC